MSRPFAAAMCCIALALGVLPAPASAQQPPNEQWRFDPAVLVADSRELLRRAPDPQIDGLFQAVHAAIQVPAEAAALCALFEPQADRSLAGLNAAAAQLSEDSQARLAGALAEVLVAAAQHPPQPFDAVAAQQNLKSTAVVAAMLNDGFVAGFNGDDDDARCRSLGMLLDAMQTRPLPERAAITRLLLDEGLAQLGSTDIDPAYGR